MGPKRACLYFAFSKFKVSVAVPGTSKKLLQKRYQAPSPCPAISRLGTCPNKDPKKLVLCGPPPTPSNPGSSPHISFFRPRAGAPSAEREGVVRGQGDPPIFPSRRRHEFFQKIQSLQDGCLSSFWKTTTRQKKADFCPPPWWGEQ